MYDMKPFLTRFFMGPYEDRRSAIRGVVLRHGERSMVIGFHDGNWWAQPRSVESFQSEAWPETFEFVDRWEAGVAHLRGRFQSSGCDERRLDEIHRHAVADDFMFANWLTDEDFKVKLPEPPEDVRLAANLAGDNDDMFFKLIARMNTSHHPDNFNSRKDRRQ